MRPTRVKRGRALLAVIASAVALVHCELVIDASHLDTETDRDSGDGGGTLDGSHRDGTVTPDGGPAPDTSMGDVSTPDGDATLPSDAGDAGGYCARQQGLAFCCDFDENSLTFAVPMSWGPPYLVDASMNLDDATSVSPPASMRVVLDPVNTVKTVAKMSTVLNVTVSQVHIAFDMRLDTVDTAKPSSLLPFDITVGNGSTTFALYLEIAANAGAGIGDSGASIYYSLSVNGTTTDSNNFPMSRAPVVGQWTHVNIDFSVGAQNGVVTAAFNDASVLDGGSFQTGGAATSLDFELGPTVFAPTDAWAAHFDNFTVRYE